MATAKTNNKIKKFYYGTGRRKTSIAKVFMTKGEGNITVNKKHLDNYFGRETSRMVVRQPLVVTEMLNKFDINAVVLGGGSNGQAGAIRLGIARALLEYEEENNLTPAINKMDEAAIGVVTVRGPIKAALRNKGLLTRDSRQVERKKVGRHKARKGTQYSKR